MNQCLRAYGWSIWLLHFQLISLHLSLPLLSHIQMVDRSRVRQRFLLACTQVLVCKVRRQVGLFLQCTQFWTGCKVHRSDVHPKLVCKYWWLDWWLVHEHSTSLFLDNPFVDHRTYLLLLLMKPFCIFHMCIRFLGSIDHSAYMRHFLSDNRHTRTCDSISLDQDMVCVRCILVSNNQEQSSFWLLCYHLCPQPLCWRHGGLQPSMWCCGCRILPPRGAVIQLLSFHKLFFPR